MSRARDEFKGKPSVTVEVLKAGEPFKTAVFIKPPSPNARKIWFQSMTEIAELEENGKEGQAINKFAELATSLILITNCDEDGKPFFLNEDKAFLNGEIEGEEFDKGYYDRLVIEGAKMMKLNEQMTKFLLLDVDEIMGTAMEDAGLGKPSPESASLSQMTQKTQPE